MLKQGAKIVATALLSLGVAVDIEALTLGRSRGGVLIGQSLNIVVPVQMEAGEDAASLCLGADVFHADNRQDPSRVRVLVEAAAQPQTAVVRILSSAIVDEPVVTVVLRTGCGQKTSRRYVLLADPPSEVAAPSVPQIGPAPAPARGNASSIAAVPASSPAATVLAARAKVVRAPGPTVRPGLDNKGPGASAVVESPRAAKPDEKRAIARSAGQSRLKLDPLELLSDRVDNLDTTKTFAPTEDALRNIQKVQTLEGDVKALLALTAKNEASLMDLRARLQKAEVERFPAVMLYGLIALVLACLTAVAFLWSRLRRVQAVSDDWWSGSVATPAPRSTGTHPEPPPESLTVSQHANKVQPLEKPAAPLSKPFNESGPSLDVDVNLAEMSDSNFDQFMPSGATHPVERQQSPSHLPAATSPAGFARNFNFNSEAVLDLRQQADFFLSLGQTDQAVHILKKQISESAAPNPFVYLDLLSIFHALGLKSDFEQVREHFNHVFNGSVLEFPLFKDEGGGLEAYPDFLSTITALWPAPQVVAFIESWIFKSSLDSAGQALDLAAFRDLLLLHAVAQNIVAVPQSDAREPKVVDRPLSVSPGFYLEATRPAGALDLDLSQSNADGSSEGDGFVPSLAADIDLSRAMTPAGDVDADAQAEAATWPLAPKK